MSGRLKVSIGQVTAASSQNTMVSACSLLQLSFCSMRSRDLISTMLEVIVVHLQGLSLTKYKSLSVLPCICVQNRLLQIDYHHL